VNPGRLSFGEAYLYAETTALFTRRFKYIKKKDNSQLLVWLFFQFCLLKMHV
jgi:hypothetical protein